MVDRSYLARLRTSGGPSHDLLVLLNQHRVMTTGQLARATGAPERTVRFRLERMREAHLVDCARPGRESGSAPRHWWLRPAGARLVAGVAAADGHPSGMFVNHAAAITEVWLALTEHGPAAGIRAGDWFADRAGWQEWEGPGAWSHRYRLTPDAVARIGLSGDGSTVAFLEVDLASMTQTLLKQKVARYLAYAADRAWQGVHPHCPPLLMLTTTATRAATFVRAAGHLISQHGHQDATDPAAALVVAACGHVRDPARAVTEPCWMLPEAAAAELTLAELLAERLDAQASSEAWHTHQNMVMRRRTDLDALESLHHFTGLADWLGSQPAAETVRMLIGTNPAAFLDDEPHLAHQIIDWTQQRRRTNRFEARDLARPLTNALEDRHAALWAQQARQLLAANQHLAAADPHLCLLATILAGGNLASEHETQVLNAPPTRTRQQLQQHVLAEYPARRSTSVDATWHALQRRARRRTGREQLTAAYDDQHLSICDTCEIVYPNTEPQEAFPERCTYCDGALLNWPDRAAVVSLAQRLDAIRHRLDEDRAPTRPAQTGSITEVHEGRAPWQPVQVKISPAVLTGMVHLPTALPVRLSW